jgi:hypothetical protein
MNFFVITIIFFISSFYCSSATRCCYEKDVECCCLLRNGTQVGAFVKVHETVKYIFGSTYYRFFVDRLECFWYGDEKDDRGNVYKKCNERNLEKFFFFNFNVISSNYEP